jgi:HEAT repeat protein
MRLEYLKKGTFVHSTRTPAPRRRIDSAAQNEIEGLLARVAAGDRAAASDVLERSGSWVGKTQRTDSTTRSIAIAMNFPELHQREAAIEAAILLDGVAKGEAGVQRLEAQLPTPVGRPWALWMLGALGNRGIDPVHTAKIIGAYIDNPDANTRAAAVNGLAVLGTDETIPMLLDRFRNDPSPVVQERAACSIAESGMYTHEQRMVAAATLVSWLDDSLLSPQQHAWTIQALADISHQNFGNDSGAWRSWYESARVASS